MDKLMPRDGLQFQFISEVKCPNGFTLGRHEQCLEYIRWLEDMVLLLRDEKKASNEEKNI